jgi:hypothetical protein
MKNRCCSRSEPSRYGISAGAHPAILLLVHVLIACLLVLPRAAAARDAPAWMHAQVAAPLPSHDEKTDAVLLYTETVLTVHPDGTLTRLERKVYRILRPDGERFGLLRIPYDSESRVTGLHAWAIPASGKDFETKDTDVVESAMQGILNGELATDLRMKLLRIPAASPGNLIGYELERVQKPYQMLDDWEFQEQIPVREAHYTLQLPPGWSYKSSWLNHPEQAPSAAGPGQWEWKLNDVDAIRPESYMPPWQGIAGQLAVSLLPPNAKAAALGTWHDVGDWYLALARGRDDASGDIRQKVAELTSSAATPLAKLQALAGFVQGEVRYVAIELGIGGYQPHAAADVFTRRYGDCKDKATLLRAMLREIGFDSYYVIINTQRGSIGAGTPPNLDFNHVILAIALPTGVTDPSLQATMTDPKLGTLLFFDPTEELMPFGRISGPLQANYGLLVRPDASDLVALPQLPSESSAVQRTAHLTLDEKGTLVGDVHEVRFGDQAVAHRSAVSSATAATDRIKPVEAVVAESFTSVQLLKASLTNLHAIALPFVWNYTLQADNYAKVTGDLLLVRPRVLGVEAQGFLETKEPRQYPIEFTGPEHDTDSFEIVVPAGFEPDELPPPVNADYGFASYQSKTEFSGQVLRYTRSFEIKSTTVPVEKADDLRTLYRIITNDERMSAVLKRSSP